jgi:hypothetical protein
MYCLLVRYFLAAIRAFSPYVEPPPQLPFPTIHNHRDVSLTMLRKSPLMNRYFAPHSIRLAIHVGSCVAVSFLACTQSPSQERRPEPEPSVAVTTPLTEVPAPAFPAPAVAVPSSYAIVHSDADPALSRLRPAFRGCYQQGLKRNPALAGKVIVHASLDAHGTVVATEIERIGLTEAVAACIGQHVKATRFAAPGRPSRLDIPVTFAKPSDAP